MNMTTPKAALLGLFACLLAGPLATVAHAQDSIGVERLTGTLKKIKDSGTVTIGFRDASEPFSYLNSARRPIGYTIDLCLAIVDAIKAELGLPDIAVKYLPVNPQTRIPLVVDGTIDLECGQTTKNAERQRLVSFSPIIFVSGTKLLVKRSSKHKSYRDLKNRTVAVTEGTTNEAALKSLNAKMGIGISILPVRENDQAFAAWKREKRMPGRATMPCCMRPRPNPGARADFAVLDDFISYDPYGIMYRKNDPALDALGKGDLRAAGPGSRARTDLRAVVHPQIAIRQDYWALP
jgi:glutamate/aspartate transport system substrate-binding protein